MLQLITQKLSESNKNLVAIIFLTPDMVDTDTTHPGPRSGVSDNVMTSNNSTLVTHKWLS